MVRLGKCEGVDSRGTKNACLAVSIADVPLKLKELLLLSCSVEENIGSSSDFDLFLLSTIVNQAVAVVVVLDQGGGEPRGRQLVR